MTEASETKPCPFCAEDILLVAMKCKHCGEYLPPPSAPEEHVVGLEIPMAKPRSSQAVTSESHPQAPPPPRKPIPLAILVLVAAALGGVGVGLYYYIGIYRPILAKGPGRILYAGDQPVEWECRTDPSSTVHCGFKNVSDAPASWCLEVVALHREGRRRVLARTVCARDIPPGETVIEQTPLDVVERCTDASTTDWTRLCKFEATPVAVEKQR